MNWNNVKQQIDGINDHYSMDESQHKLVYKYAKQVPKSGVVLELGVAHGKTSALFCAVGIEKGYEFYGIDDFSLEGTSNEVYEIINSFDIIGGLIISKTQDAEWNREVDLLLIDAGHDEANVKADCEKYIPYVKQGGIVIFDDFGDIPAHWAVKQYGEQATQGWEKLFEENHMAGFRRPT